MDRLQPVYGPLCAAWEYDMPLELQDGCGHDSCWFTGTWGRLSGGPRPPEPAAKRALP